MRTRTLLALPLMAGLALSIASPASAETQLTLTPVSDGWYQANPTCALASGCLPPVLPAAPPATTPFPARTLHIGVNQGQETARAVLAFDLSGVSPTTGVLTIPLDTDAADGSAAPETAKALVCLTFSTWQPADGGLGDPPKADCAKSAALTFAATPMPHLQAELGAVLDALPAATGLVLIPDGAKLTPTDTWRVVFSAHDRAGAGKTAPGSLLLSVPDIEQPEQFEQPGFSVPSGQPTFSPQGGPAFAGGVVAPPPVPEVPTPFVAPTAVPLRQRSVAGPVLTSGHYPYLALGLLPLGALLLTWFLGRALTKDLAVQAGRARNA